MLKHPLPAIRVFGVAGLMVLLASAAAAQQTRRPLTHRDYDSWRSIQNPLLSRDGRYLAYGLFPQDGDGQVVVQELATRKEFRQDAGAMPPPVPRLPDDPEAPPQRGFHLAFTHDSRYLAASAYPSKAETEKARKEKKKPEEMPQPGLLVIDLASGAAARIAGVETFQLPEKGGDWLAYLKSAKPAPEQTPALVAPPARRGALRREFGTEMALRDLTRPEPNERVFQDVLECSFSRDGKILAFTVASKKEEDNGVYRVMPGSESAPASLVKGKGRYARLAWDRADARLAFVCAGKLCSWDGQATAATELVAPSTSGFEKGYVVSEDGAVTFSRDGSRIFFGCAPPRPPAVPEAPPAEDKVVADLWSWKDDLVQPMQKVQAQRERTRTYPAVFHLADHQFVQLADRAMRTLIPSDNGRFALGADDHLYRAMADFDGSFADEYLVDTVTGKRQKAIQKFRSGLGPGAQFHWSPDGKYVLFYSDRNWHTLSVPEGVLTHLTAGLKVKFFDEEDDHPAPPPSHGVAGWTSDSRFVVLYDRYDVWQISGDGRIAKNVTGGVGRRDKLEFRVVRLEREDDPDAPRGIDPEKPLLLRSESVETRDSGFWRDRLNSDVLPQKLMSGPRNYRALSKAKDADVILVTASTFYDFPDLNVTDSSFAMLHKATNANPQKAEFVWGTGEMVRFRNADGIPLQAALYKPENFDPAKKYPLLVYLYERLSQNLNNFVDPKPGTSINIAYYVSNGYLVLTPDIVYTVGSPGQSALKCVLPAVEAVVGRGYIDENAIGIQGHSWGGYQAAYLVGHTTRFRAAEAGAPVGDMISAYNGIRWGSGMPRQFQYEKTQSRIGGNLWQNPMQFIENSPIFSADRIATPLLILQNDGDDAVPWYQGIELFLSLRRLGKEAYLFNYNGEFHGLRKRHNQKDYTVRLQQFFDHFLKGAPKPEWMEKGIPYLERDVKF